MSTLEKPPEQPAQSGGSAQSIDHHPDAEQRLASVLRRVHGAHCVEIEELKTKGAAIWAEPNFILERLLEAFSTMGNSRGVKLVRDSSLHEQVSYPALAALAADERLLVLTRTLRAARVCMPDRKAAWLLTNFERIQADGGPDVIKQRLVFCS